MHHGSLPLASRPDTDAEHRDPRIHGRESGHEAGLGSGRAGRVHDMVDPQPLFVGPVDELERTTRVSEGADLVRAAAWDQVRFATGTANLLGDRPHRCVRVDTGRQLPELGTEQAVQQHVAVAAILDVVRPHPILEQEDAARPSRAAIAAVRRP